MSGDEEGLWAIEVGPGDGDALRGATLAQADFGGFDARFIGVTIHLSTARAWKLVLATPEAETEAQLAKAAAEGPGALFESVALMTLWPHEVRHVHDNLIAPYGSEVFWRRFMSAFYGMQLATAIRAQPATGTIIPIPVTKWLRANADEREALLRGWRSYTGTDASIVAALEDDHGLGEDGDDVLRSIVTHSNGLRELFLDPEGLATPARSLHVAEASALLVQMATIQARFGSDLAQAFISALVGLPKSAYARALQQLTAVIANAGGDRVELPVASAIVTWCQLGDLYDAPKDAMPIIRFAKLGQWLERNGVPDLERVKDVEAVFGEWDRGTGSGSTLAGVEAALRKDDQLLGVLERRRAESAGQARLWLDKLVPFARQWLAARQRVSGAFLNDPSLYCDPIAYVHTDNDDYLEPPCLYELDGRGVPRSFFDDTHLADVGFEVLEELTPEDTSSDEPRVVAFGGPQPESPPIVLQDAYEFSRWQLLTDYLCGEFRRDIGEFEQSLADVVFRKRGLVPLEILD